MRIVENTPDTFVMVDEPWLAATATWAAALTCLAAAVIDPHGSSVALRLFLAVLAAVFAWVAWRHIPFRRITFDRQAGEVRQVSRRLWTREEAAMPLDAVEQARQQADYMSDTGGPMWRLALDLVAARAGGSGPVPLTDSYGARPLDAERDALNAWLAGPD